MSVESLKPLWKVAVDTPLHTTLTYRAPAELAPMLKRGESVIVPLGKSRKVPGVLVEPAESSEFQLKDIAAVDSGKPLLHESYLKWLEWLSKYYVHPIGQVFEMTFPPLGKAENARQKTRKASITKAQVADTRKVLTDEQASVLSAIESAPGFGVHLVHGVTGSGKTEIYMRLLEDVIATGKQGIVLVPEISLTPQLVERFVNRLGDAVAVIHSHLTPREKTNQWWAMVEGKKKILIGARSALFCPLPSLGMIVIDEEHESSFKQDEGLKYHARDAAVMLAKFSDCPVVLGSATPSLETWQNAQSGRYKLHSLKQRVAARAMPAIDVVDLRAEREGRRADGGSPLPFWLSDSLYKALVETLDRGEQAALFLNRRGVAQAVICPDCGWIPACPNCEVKLTLHGKNHLLCHYCDYHETMKETCVECHEGEPKGMGIGTELIEKDLAKLFPGARVARMDRDEITTREHLEEVVKAVENREVDILVGTQMIAKGLDFEGLTLVGLVMADVAFNLPDVRASERSFQLFTQVAGRAGRHAPGRVIIQTYNPEHPSIEYTVAHNYEGYAAWDLAFREAAQYPPFWRLANFRIQGPSLERVQRAAHQLRSQASALHAHSKAFANVQILGPAEAPLAKLRNQYRWQLLLKAPDASVLGAFCRTLMERQDWLPPGIKISVDVDSVHML